MPVCVSVHFNMEAITNRCEGRYGRRYASACMSLWKPSLIDVKVAMDVGTRHATIKVKINRSQGRYGCQ